ncbi:MAG: hypothetical protein J7647_11045 [Cyanobacteria bacterium SBLK]|nr:hypothetical protein [Cyanobacteria bacterium SBLK]
MQTPIQNELVLKELSSSDREKSVRRGLPIKKVFSLNNQGKQLAKVQVRVKGRDEQAQRLHLWCKVEPDILELTSSDRKNFTLNFEIPVSEKAEFYNYEILLIESSQYPHRTTRHFQQLRLPKSEWVEFPEFLLQPATHADNPHPLKAEEFFEVSVRVENRSDLVDCFVLNCPDLPKEWFKIKYSHENLDILGLADFEEGLNLNPNRNGTIKFLLTPPPYAPAGVYAPTLCLTSKSYREVMLLDIFYFRIIADDRLEVELSPSLCKFPTRKAKKKRDRQQFDVEEQDYDEFLDIFPPEQEARSLYSDQDSLTWNPSKTQLQDRPLQSSESDFDVRVKVSNQGNIKRQIVIKAADSENLFKYDPPSQLVSLDPGEVKTTGFQLKSPQWWRRSLKGKGQETQFIPEFENYRDRPLPDTQKPPFIPDLEELKRDRGMYLNKKLKIETTLILKPRPWWILFFLIVSIILLVLLALAGLSVGAWLLFFNMPSSPRIQNLKTVNEQQKERSIYKLENNESVFLEFAIAVPEQLDRIVVMQIDENQKKIQKTYPFPQLSSSFFTQSEVNQNSTLKINDLFCKILRFLKPRSEKQSSLELDTFLIDLENNKLVEPNREEVFIEKNNEEKNNEEKNILLPGKYQFEVQIFPKEEQTLWGVRKRSSQTQVGSRITDTIEVIPKPKPHLSNLKSSDSTYQQREQLPLVLEWTVNNREQLGKMAILRQAEEGNIEVYNYLFEKGAIKSDRETEGGEKSNEKNKREQLECEENLLQQLTCSWQQDIVNLPAGLYTFAVEVFPQDNLEEVSDRKEIKNTVFVIPKPLPKIEKFLIVEDKDKKYEEEINNEILVDFSIGNPHQIKELKIRQNSPDGRSQERVQYSYPQDLREFCSIPKPDEIDIQLVCQNVPLGEFDVGEYSFELIVIPTLEDTEQEISETTDFVEIAAKPIEIKSFKLNNKAFKNNAVEILPNYANIPQRLEFSWEVDAGKDVLVEFLPVGGIYKKRDSLSYTLPPGTSREIFILQVTDPFGKKATHVITVQAYESNNPASPNDSSGDSPSPQNIQKKPAFPQPRERPLQLN